MYVTGNWLVRCYCFSALWLTMTLCRPIGEPVLATVLYVVVNNDTLSTNRRARFWRRRRSPYRALPFDRRALFPRQVLALLLLQRGCWVAHVIPHTHNLGYKCISTCFINTQNERIFFFFFNEPNDVGAGDDDA